MKYLRILSVFIFCTISFGLLTPTTEAHLAGQPPYFKVNGSYANLYPVPLTSLSDFPLPQDLAPGTYLINQPINFELDINRLPAPPEVVKKTNFAWDFGDGAAAQGLSTSHTYSKIGSYILKITADDGTTPTPQLLESVLMNILPDPNYKLPQAKITVEGKQSSDPLTDILQFPFGRSLHFDARSSVAPSSKIVSYFWDFGDQKSSTKEADNHYYPGDLTQFFPVLRVKDANGFIADTFVEVQNQDQGIKLTPKQTSRPKTSTPPSQPYGLYGLVTLLLLAGAFMVRRSVQARDHGKHQ